MLLKNINVGGGSIVALVTKITEATTSQNKPYVNVFISDGHEEVPVKYWDTTKEHCGLEESKVYEFILKCNLYNNEKSFTLTKFVPTDLKNPIDFVKKAPVETLELYNRILKVIDTLEDKSLATLVKRVYESYKPKMLMWAAAQNHHHNYYGGLLWHTTRMVEAADHDTKLYPSINRDVVIVACALHDIGKLEEFDTSELGVVEYTMKGTLFGHLLLGYELIRKFILHLRSEGIVFEDNKVTNLLHCIASHHGEREWGAIVPPATPEAKFVFYLDLRDSQLTVFEETAQSLEVGEKAKIFRDNVYRL